MKKSVLTLLILLVCSFQRAVAYEYFVIYFSDGTKSEAFYASDVESIGYSKTDLNGIERDSWQVQEIQTIDSLYRYSLASIRYVDFKEGDMNQVIEDIANACTAITPIYAQCESIDDIAQHLSEIKSAEGVEDAWISNQTLFVKIKDWETITYNFPPEDGEYDGIFAQEALSQVRERAKAPNSGSSHQDYTEDIKKLCVINQQYRDESRESRKEAQEDFVELALYTGRGGGTSASVVSLNSPYPLFFLKDIYDYDYIFLMTHGYYDEKTSLHWLLTGEQLYVANEYGAVDNNVIWSKVQKIFDKKYPISKKKKYPLNMEDEDFANYLSVGFYKEKREGSKVPVFYSTISNKWIAASTYQFKQEGKVVIFNSACQSLMGNDNLAQAFFKKGAGQYIGYDETAHWGHVAGNGFIAGLINGKSSFVSYLSIPKRYRDYTFDDKNRKNIHTVLRRIANNKHDICITRPKTHGSYSESSISGAIWAYKPLCDFYTDKSSNAEVYKNTYGFLYSENPEMTDAKKITVDTESENFSLSDIWDNYASWKVETWELDLQPNTTFYYCAYMNDGLYDCYGEIEQGRNLAEPYTVWDEANNTETFYYDGKREMRGGVNFFDSKPHFTSNCEKVVFDSSFANYYPESVEDWFRSRGWLKTIENIQYLNTSNVTSMSMMFYGCYSLTSLDLSSFNTAHVTDMSAMFEDCKSLSSLDLSHFNTANVKDMSGMFWCCSSLMSLDLSSFDTSNVTNMNCMFYRCESLTSLDLSSFNTAHVTDMHSMFLYCMSLRSLDVSSFNTSNVTDMSGMFYYCTSLRSLDLSSFNTAHVTDMGSMFEDCKSLIKIYAGNWKVISHDNYMFYNCDNLVGGKGTKIGWNIYGYDQEGNTLEYYCNDDSSAAHIDGGKDWPGLFTAKY